MPNDRTNWMLPATAIVIMTVAFAAVLLLREPHFEGLSASDWFAKARTDPVNVEKYGLVFKRWGNSGVRFLCRRIAEENARWRQVAVGLYNRYGTRLGLKPIGRPSTGAEQRLARRLLGYFEADAAPELVKMLESRSSSNRVAAIQALLELGRAAGPIAGPHLIPLLNDSNNTIAYEAITTLAVYGYEPKTVVPLLIPFLTHPNNRTRIEASYALGSYPPMPEITLEPLLAALNDSDRVVQANAARAIGAMGPAARRAVQPLSELLSGTEVLPSARAVEAIALILGGSSPELPEDYQTAHARHLNAADRYNRLMVLHASLRLGWPLDQLETTCYSLISNSVSNWQVWEALDVMAELQPQLAWTTSVLEKAAAHPNALVRAKARILLGR